jgi:hypothetical protein
VCEEADMLLLNDVDVKSLSNEIAMIINPNVLKEL